MDFRDFLAVFEPIRENPEGESLRFRNRVIAIYTVSVDAGKFGHFADPPSVFLTLNFDLELAHRFLRQFLFRGLTNLRFTGANRTPNSIELETR